MKKIKNSNKDKKLRVLTENDSFYTVETYKSIRTNVMFSLPMSDGGKVIPITSSIPDEGKTTTAINLAIVFAQTGERVLLIDCDLRKSRVHRYLGLERKNGLSNVICGYLGLEDAIKKNVRPNLDCITAGEIPPNPAELLDSDEFIKIINELKKKYDYIFIDTPPVVVVTDAAIILHQADGVIIVSKENHVTYDALDVTMNTIKNIDVKILGVIMTGCSDKKMHYNYYGRGKRFYGNYKYKYQYRYGDDNVKENGK